jgi:hypothetical protein
MTGGRIFGRAFQRCAVNMPFRASFFSCVGRLLDDGETLPAMHDGLH